MTKVWQPYQNDLKRLYPVTPTAVLVKLFPFSKKSIQNKANQMKLKKKGKLHAWHYADELELIKMYPHTTNAEIAKKISKTESAVVGAAFKLGLRKTPAFMAFHTAKSHFKKGQIPPNKGKKQTEYMTAEAIERTKATRFKRGRLPHNCYHEVGKITTRTDNSGRPYLYICIAIGRWQLYHRYLWENINAKVPKNHCLWFKDGNSLNCQPDNLECISRQENLNRNAHYDNPSAQRIAYYLSSKNRRKINRELQKEFLKHPEIIDAKRLQILLNRKIKSKENGTK